MTNGSGDRRLRWVSSTTGSPAALEELERRMTAFYSHSAHRERYQRMLDSQEDAPIPAGSLTEHLLIRIARSGARSVVEVGCGNGWLYRHLRRVGYGGAYTGLEMAPWLIDRNRARHPEARWEAGTVYRLPNPADSVDACFAFYVLEHTVYPTRALAEMLRIVAPGGSLLLAFPDFRSFGFLPSQQTGLSPGNAREKLARGRYWDAALTLFDSRVRIRPRIRRASSCFGPFPVNTRPLCLDHPDLMWADIDAIYVAGKVEVADWARGQGCMVEFPCGTEGFYAHHAYLDIRKPAG
jgi:SAM-dependent methyltransferase